MPWRTRLAWCLAITAPLASAFGDGSNQRGQPEVDPRLDALEAENFQDKVAASRDRARAAVARAQANAARTSATALTVQQLVSRSQARNSALKALLKGAEFSSDKATRASKASTFAVESVEPLTKAMPEMVKEQAVQAVEKMFSSEFVSLDSWRKTVLTNPHEQGQRAAVVAAQPYNNMLGVLYGRMGSYQAQARSLAAQAQKAAGDAEATAAGAQAKMQLGNIVGAKQDLQMARAIQVNGARLAAAAQTTQARAADMNKLIPEYVAAQQAAARKAEYDANPEALPPLMIDPDFAFTPPPSGAGPAPAPAPSAR